MSSKKGVSKKKADTLDQESKVFNRLPIGMMVIDSNGTVQFINEHLTNQMEIKSKDLTGTMLFDILEPSCIPDVLSLIRSETKYITQHTLILNPPKGRSVHGIFSFEDYPLKDGNGYLMILMDRKVRAMKREIGFETLEEIPIPITIVDRELEPIFQNSATDEWVSLISKRSDPITKPPKVRKESLMECFARGSTVSYSIKVKTQEDPFEFNVTAVPFPSRERADKALEIWLAKEDMGKKGPKTFVSGIGEELIETSTAIIIGLDMEGNIELFNTGATRALGYEFDQVKGTSWFDYLVDRDLERGRLEVFQWSISSGFRTQYEVRVRANAGNALTISMENTVLFDDEGNVRMILMVGQDITKMKGLETSLREQSEKLVEAMDEVSLYNDLMSHDIHNANAGIMGYLELMNMTGIDEEKRKSYIHRALREVKKSSSIIKDVKVMSLAKPVGEPVPVSLAGTFDNVTARFRKEQNDDLPALETDIADLHVLADEMIEEGFIRILDHSMIVREGKVKRISINARRDPSKSRMVSEAVHVTITTEWKEKIEDDVQYVFDRPKRTDLGSRGLGLYLVKRIIDRYGGMIGVDKLDNGKGMRVNILLREAV